MKKTIFIDERIKNIYANYIKSLGYDIVKIPKNELLYSEISSHTDILMLKVKNSIIVEKNLYENDTFKKFLSGEKCVNKDYPNDVLYNVCIIGNYAIHNFKYTDNKVLECIDKNNIEKIDIKQGYSKCSIAVVDENSCITSEKEVYQKLTKKGIDVLFISKENEKNIKLYDKDLQYSFMNGFIGGATLKLDNKFILFGDYKKLLDGEKIKDFVIKKGYEFIYFENQDIIDYGSAVVLD